MTAPLCNKLAGQRWPLLVSRWKYEVFIQILFKLRHRQKKSDRLRGFAPRQDCSSFKLLFFHTSPPLPPLTPTPRLKTQARFHPHRSVSAAYCFFFFFLPSASPEPLCSVQRNGSGNSSSVTLQNLHPPASPLSTAPPD